MTSLEIIVTSLADNLKTTRSSRANRLLYTMEAVMTSLAANQKTMRSSRANRLLYTMKIVTISLAANQKTTRSRENRLLYTLKVVMTSLAANQHVARLLAIEQKFYGIKIILKRQQLTKSDISHYVLRQLHTLDFQQICL